MLGQIKGRNSDLSNTWAKTYITSQLCLVGGLVAIFCMFPWLLGMSSSQLTNSYFFRGLAQPLPTTNQNITSQLWNMADYIYIIIYIYISPYPTNENRKDFWFLQPVGVWNLADSIPEIGWSSHERDFKTTGYLVVGQGHRTPNPHEVVHTYLYIYIYTYIYIYIYI